MYQYLTQFANSTDNKKNGNQSKTFTKTAEKTTTTKK